MPLSTTQYGYIIDPLVPLTDDSGRTISNGYVRVFMTGTSTPVITYKNFDGATNEETVQLDNSGRTAYPVIVSKGNNYKVCVYDSEHSQESPILTIDKVVPQGANVSATNIVTGLDNVESPAAGWVKSTVTGTDAEVSLDATNVTSEVDTIVKATAASADYMIPLVHKTGSDPDKKISLGNNFKFVLNFIHSLTDTATEADLVAGNYLALDGSAGTKKLNSTTLLTKTAQNALAGNVAPAFDPARDEKNPYLAGETVMYGGGTYIFKNDHFGAWDASDVEVYNNLASRVKDSEETTSNVKEHFSFVEDEGNLYVIDSFGAICLIIDKDGHLIVPSVTGPGSEFGLTDENGNAALKVDYSGSVRLNIALDSLQKNLNKSGANLSACGGDYFLSTPKYVFGTESSTLRGREYFTAIYPEGCVNIEGVQFLIDGFRKKLFQKLKSSSSTDNTAVSEEILHCKIKAPFYREKDFAVRYIRANRKNAQNKKIFWLAIGDSLTAATGVTFPNGDVYGGYVNGLKQFAAMDNADVGSIEISTLGTRNEETEIIEYESNTISCKTINAGRGGWTTWDFANFFEHSPLQLTSEAGYLSIEALYYAVGLATKTPFDSSTPGQTYKAFEDSDDTRYEIVSTPIGRFKPDCNEVLWEALKLWSDFPGTGDYFSGTSDPIIISYLESKESNPTNEFYSLDTARAYTGDHEWTYTCAFSMSEYLGRYRTYDDNGLQLTLGEGAGSKITADNINTYVVMAPTHLTVCLGANDAGLSDERKKDVIVGFLNHIKTLLPSVHIGYALPRDTGVYNPGSWSDFGLLNRKGISPGTRSVNENKLIMDAIGCLPSGYGVSYIPVHFTSSPVSTSTYDRVVEDMDSGEKLVVAGTDTYHPSATWYKSTAYQILSWIYWTLRN